MSEIRLIMVARPAVASMCNDAAQNSIADGNRPFDVPLRVAGDATNTIVAYWCDWLMDTATASKIQTWMLNHGATTAEASLVPVGTSQSVIRQQRIAIFRDPDWTPDQVLSVLGLDVLAVIGP